MQVLRRIAAKLGLRVRLPRVYDGSITQSRQIIEAALLIRDAVGRLTDIPPTPPRPKATTARAAAQSAEPETATDAPVTEVVTPLRTGRETNIRVRGEPPIPATYAVVEASSLIPSHDPLRNFVRNPKGDPNARP